jgi:prepilin-type N-terminal cleavage/methylation domain-containing protein
MQYQKTVTHNQSGFSLIELLVVVAIIGILASAGAVGYTKYIDGVKQDTQTNNAQTLAKALDAIATLRSGNLSVKETGCDGNNSVQNCAQQISATNKWNSPYDATVTGVSYISTTGCTAGPSGAVSRVLSLTVTSAVSGVSASGTVSDCGATPKTFTFNAW